MENQKEYIELYPGNWLNNASVLGFLLSLHKIEGKNVKDYMLPDGRLVLPRNIFDELKVPERYFTDKLCECLIIGNVSKTSKEKYINYINPSNKTDRDGFGFFVKELHLLDNNGHTCALSNTNFVFNLGSVTKLNKKWEELGANAGSFERFLSSITKVSNRISEKLGGADSYPNGYWAFKNSTYINPLFAFLIIHQHLAFTELLDKTKVFINAPSFRMMYELKKVLGEFAGKEKASYRNLLAMSVVEFSIRTNVVLHTWAGMDIEIVAIKKDKIEFISLPYDTIRLLSNKRIAELISSIGDFRILNIVIDHKWDNLVELGYRLLKIAMNGIGKEDRNFIGQFYAPDNYRTETNIKILANKLLKLYSLIEERTKRNSYEYNDR